MKPGGYFKAPRPLVSPGGEAERKSDWGLTGHVMSLSSAGTDNMLIGPLCLGGQEPYVTPCSHQRIACNGYLIGQGDS